MVNAPMVIGHETAGTVAEVGDGVSSLAVGDRVALEPGEEVAPLVLSVQGHASESGSGLRLGPRQGPGFAHGLRDWQGVHRLGNRQRGAC